MYEPFLGSIMLFAGNFPPRNWAFCNGQLLSIQQNTALFSLLGTNYGGNGVSTFGLPDLRGRAPMHVGASPGPGLSPRALGQLSGEESVTLLLSEIPNHAHAADIAAVSGAGTNASPAGRVWAASTSRDRQYVTTTPDIVMKSDAVAIAPAGASIPHNNMQPFLTLNFIIALQGIYPPRP
jgi:microcystin-dependent protein